MAGDQDTIGVDDGRHEFCLHDESSSP